MSEPWFNEMWFGTLYGSIVGGGICGMGGGTLGGLIGYLAPQGKGRTVLLGAMKVFVLFGFLNLAFGLVALLAGQPYGIWYGPVLLGFLMPVLFGCLLPVARKRYAEAEQRRLQAESLRQGSV